MVPSGSAGYQHSSVASAGQWGPLGDRFAGSVLMAEMLAWAHPDVRRAAWGESYFAPDELQHESERYEILAEALRVYEAGFDSVFEEVWWADSLDSCPPLKTWYDLVDTLPREPVAEWAPIDASIFLEEVPTPPEIAVGKPKDTTPARVAESAPERAARRGRLPVSGRGCRSVALVTAAVGLICCLASFLAIELTALQGNPSCVSSAAVFGLPLIGIMILASRQW
jgi:hypothetical protein